MPKRSERLTWQRWGKDRRAGKTGPHDLQAGEKTGLCSRRRSAFPVDDAFGFVVDDTFMGHRAGVDEITA